MIAPEKCVFLREAPNIGRTLWCVDTSTYQTREKARYFHDCSEEHYDLIIVPIKDQLFLATIFTKGMAKEELCDLFVTKVIKVHLFVVQQCQQVFKLLFLIFRILL